MSEKHKLILTDFQLSVVQSALEAYNRAHLGQFKLWKETTFDFIFSKEDREKFNWLDWDEGILLEDLLKHMIFKKEVGISSKHGSLGISNVPQEAREAYKITKVIEEFNSVRQNDGYWGWHRGFDGGGLFGGEIPEIEGFDKWKEYPIDKKHFKKLDKLHGEKNFDDMWGICGEYFPEEVDGNREIVKLEGNWVARIYKPRKNEN